MHRVYIVRNAEAAFDAMRALTRARHTFEMEALMTTDPVFRITVHTPPASELLSALFRATSHSWWA